jgi:DNA repair exonuclease SbcCD ATPase subunit
MSLQFEQISFRNFLSFGNQTTTISLDTPGTTFIYGENVDKGGSSGSGKSSIVNAICYCLFDKTPANIGKERLINNINNNTKSTQMEVTLTFTKDGDRYEIKRGRGESYSIYIKKNDQDITPDSVVNTNKRIEEIIGISYELFTRVVMFNGNALPFLDLSVNEQRNLIEELLKITTLSQKATLLKEEIKNTEQSIKIQQVVITQQEAQNELHKKHLREAQDRIARWDSQNSRDIEDLKKQLNRIAGVDFETEELLHSENNRIKNDLSLIISKLTSEERELRDASKKFNEKEKELSHLVDNKCPYCLQKFEDATSKIAELEDESAKYAEIITRVGTEVEVLIEKRDALKGELHEIDQARQHTDLSELLKIKNNAETMAKELEKLKTQTNPHVEAFDALQNEDEIKIDYDLVDSLTKLLEHQKFLLKLLTDKNSFIRKAIISKTIPFLNKRIAHYLDELILPHAVVFQPDMSCEISEFGRELDHGNLSAGEKKRLNLSLSLAFRDVLTHLHNPVNLMLTDEVDGGSLDTNCVDALIRLLKHKAWDEAINIYVISHRPEFEGRCDNTIIVRKENGFSTLLTDDVKTSA